MGNRLYLCTKFFFLTAIIFLSFIAVSTPVVGQTEINPRDPQPFAAVVFSKSDLMGPTSSFPTSLQFGPDDKLYVADMLGTIRVYEVVRNGVDDYEVAGMEVIDIVSAIPNFDDNGDFNSLVTGRLVTGILVVGEADNPVIYVVSSDPRRAEQYEDIPLDTNSGILSMVTQSTPGSWANPNRLDLARGIPRNKENHVPNGLQIGQEGGITYLYLAEAGNTNMGAPSISFAYQSEYALSAAILKFDLDALMAMPTIPYTYPNGVLANYKYDLPTLDDPDRPGDPDLNDPFGGNSALPWAKNQARLVPGGPVQLHATGFRNPYDVLIASDGRMYTIDNGPNKDWGGPPENEGPQGDCTNTIVNNSVSSFPDNLHYVRAAGGSRYYGGHPNPVRGNPAGIFGSEENSPIPFALADPVECDFREPGAVNGALATWDNSTNGLAEYTASNFGGELQGDLLAAGWNSKNLYRVKLSYDAEDNPLVEISDTLFSNVSNSPLDVIAQGDQDPFPGTIWVAEFLESRIIVFEPQDIFVCQGTYDSTLDEDGDGYNNADEIDNATSPCNPADIPADNDGDFLSDLNDPDDDNDNLLDEDDPFAIDAENGKAVSLPVDYAFNSTDKGILASGFTGLMSNGSDNYQNLYDPTNMTAGGAGGVFTIDDVPAGTAYGNTNTLAYGFQFGINSCEVCLPFTAESLVLLPLQTISGTIGSQAVGMFIGTGDQDNYISIMAHGSGGSGGVQVVYESDGVVVADVIVIENQLLTTTVAAFSLTIDPVAATVQPGYSLDGGARVFVGSPLQIPTGWLDGETGLAVGIMATSNGSDPFSATWDRLTVRYETPAETGIWSVLNSTNEPQARHENGFVELNGKFYLIGGRGIKPVDIYDPVTDTWTAGASTPLEIHHFQAVTWNGLIYVIGAMTEPYPNEIPVPYVLIYDPYNDLWLEGPAIPRPRGSAGVVVYKNKIYMVGGIENGHISGTQPWFDEFNPATNTWTSLTDAPHDRDHVHAAVLDGKLFVAGGRVTDLPVPFDQTIAEVDVYDFATATWSSPTIVPTERAGAGLVTLGKEVVLIGGESTQPDAHEEVEAYDYVTNSWRVLADLPSTPTDEDRHGTQAIEYNDSIYMAAGSGGQGGSPELKSQVQFDFGNSCPLPQPPSGGLAAEPETLEFGTITFGQPVTATVTLSAGNPTGPVMVMEANIVGADMAAFGVARFIPTYLSPGGTMTVDVVFDPPEPGSYGIGDSGRPNAALSLRHSGWNSALIVPLSGSAVVNEIPISGLEVTSNSPVALGSPSLFSAVIDTGTNVVYDWDFGDGITLTNGSMVEHTYSTLGTYLVTVIARNNVNSMTKTTTMEIVPQPAFELRLNSGGDNYTDVSGKQWSADQYYSGFIGTYITGAEISGTLDDPLYQTERYGNGQYDIPLPVNGCYQVRLHFAEIWFAPGGGGGQIPGNGERIFDVFLENSATPFLDDYDINADVGPETAVVFEEELNINDGVLNISFGQIVEYPKISAIEVISKDCFPVGPAYVAPGSSGVTSDGVSYDANDVLYYDPLTAGWSLFFDGSAAGLTGGEIDAFLFVNSNRLIFSFADPIIVPGLDEIDDSDLVTYRISSNSFSLHLDGSDVGLGSDNEDIDALAMSPDYRLLISTVGPFKVRDVNGAGLAGDSSDLLKFINFRFGADTKGRWEYYFDGSDVGFNGNEGNLKGVSVVPNGDLHFTLAGPLDLGFPVDGNDVVVCAGPVTGVDSACGQLALYWDAGSAGLGAEAINGLHTEPAAD